MMTETLPVQLSTSFGLWADDIFQNPQHEVITSLGQSSPAFDRNVPPTGFIPALDLSEVNGTIEVRMDIPGVKAEEIKILVTDDVLLISGKRKREIEKEGKNDFWNERRIGTFSRSFSLPCPVVIDAVTAKYQDGVLTISLPKLHDPKTMRINVIVR